MSELQDRAPKSECYVPVKFKIYLCLFSEDENFINFVSRSLDRDTFKIKVIASGDSLIEVVRRQEKVDCLLLTDVLLSRDLVRRLKQEGIFLPTAIAYTSSDFTQDKTILYHPAEVKFNFDSKPISDRINLALTQFLNLDENQCITDRLKKQVADTYNNPLTQQQRKLAKKLQERLGYLGIYYKRNPQNFYQNLNDAKQKQLVRELAQEYRKIILSYFENEPKINQIIDRFVNAAFFSNISVSQVLEIHMELMDEFSQQLKLERRSEDILLDYRLALIDIIAHLCEMYRRGIPNEDISLSILSKID